MRMYVIVAIIVALLLLVLLVVAFGLVRLKRATREARKRDEVAARLAAVVAQAEQEHRAREADLDAGSAITLVLPAIRQPDDGKPRRVA
jgi:flagellar biosynthesis/type III secretory pathway M-ring protein FliF/YscJ